MRPIRPDDSGKLLQMWQRLSPETIRMRFFAPRTLSPAEVGILTDVDYDRRFSLVAETGGRIVGVSRFDEDPTTAEFAVLVEDAEQGRGIGTVLLRALVEPAQDLGVNGFVTEQSLATEDEQDRRAAVAALSAVFARTSIAVAGASRDPRSAIRDPHRRARLRQPRARRFHGAGLPGQSSGDPRGSPTAEVGPVELCEHQQQGRHLRQRPPAVLGERSRHRRHPAVPGVVRERP